ncbi:MAG TPA: hypothetical protein VGC99_11145 [Candidatus Tectomicrobia bacterium]
MDRQRHDEITPNLAERWCWGGGPPDDSRVTGRLYRKQEVDGVYRLGEGAVLDNFFHFLKTIGMMVLRDQVHGAAIPRQMVSYVPYLCRHQDSPGREGGEDARA